MKSIHLQKYTSNICKNIFVVKVFTNATSTPQVILQMYACKQKKWQKLIEVATVILWLKPVRSQVLRRPVGSLNLTYIAWFLDENKSMQLTSEEKGW